MPKMADSIKRAEEICRYLRNMPEDYVESRTSWNELYDQLSDLRWGFEDAMRRQMTDSMKRAKDICELLRDYPEDYVDSRTSWNKLYEQLSDLRWGFEDAMQQLGLDDEEENDNDHK